MLKNLLLRYTFNFGKDSKNTGISSLLFRTTGKEEVWGGSFSTAGRSGTHVSGGRQAGKSNQANFSTTYTGQGSVRKRVLTSSDSQNTSSTPYRKETHFAVPAVLALSRRCSPLNTVNSGHFARETTVSLPIRVRLVVLT